jgi:hypothetical protein
MFLVIRTLVLRRENSTAWSFYVLPVMLLVTVWTNGFFIITKYAVGGTGEHAQPPTMSRGGTGREREGEGGRRRGEQAANS